MTVRHCNLIITLQMNYLVRVEHDKLCFVAFVFKDIEYKDNNPVHNINTHI
jgi:hypothetical protein